MEIKLPFKLKVKFLYQKENVFEGKAIFHEKEYSINIHAEMNKKTIKAVSRRILRTMMEDEKQLKVLLKTETHGVPERQLDGLLIKIEQQLGRIMVNQNKLILLQDITDE